MATLTSLQQAIDNTGNPYPAIRVSVVQFIAATAAATTPLAALQPTTKVVRVCSPIDIIIGGFQGAPGSLLVGAGFFQDFLVQPGDALTVRGLTADGNVSVAELV